MNLRKATAAGYQIAARIFRGTDRRAEPSDLPEPLRQVPHWAYPLAICVVLLAVSVTIVDDYKVRGDTVTFQRELALRTVDYILGDSNAYWETGHGYYTNFYGVAFEMPMLLVERILGLEDFRHIYIGRHLMTHLFFIAAGWFCYLLVYRMTNSRLLALFAMLLFLLHPRMYGNSFFNDKDLPFLSMFMIALFCVHWAFRRGTVAAFLVCGAAVGILISLRIMGIMLLPAVLAMRAVDIYYAGSPTERKQALISTVAFALSAIAIYYASMPYLWSAPIDRFTEMVTLFYRHHDLGYELFRGQYIYSPDLPAYYIPYWIAITTPPLVLLLSATGIAAVAWRIVAAARARSAAVLHNTGLRFALLLVAVAVLPLLGAAVLSFIFLDGWRRMYFLWAPLCLLAAPGLQLAASGLAQLPFPGRFRLPARVYIGALAGITLAVVIAQNIQLHPYQHLYFNLLMDRKTPEYLGTQYDIDYNRTARLEAYQWIIDNHPGEAIHTPELHNLPLYLNHPSINDVLAKVPEAQRRRFVFDPRSGHDYYVDHGGRSRLPAGASDILLPPVIYSRQVYNNTIMRVMAANLSLVDADTADFYRILYRTATQGEPVLRSRFDVYRSGKQLTLAQDDCRPEYMQSRFEIWMYPTRGQDLPVSYRRLGRTFTGAPLITFDGKCLAQITLPDYDIGRIDIAGVGTILSDDYVERVHQRYDSLASRKPAIHSDFTVYMQDGALHYLKPDCTQRDTAAWFYLHIIPADSSNLPATRQEYGYANLDFQWSDFVASDVYHVMRYGIAFEGRCMITVPLPDYDIAAIRTGQFVPGAGRLWGGEFAVRPAQN